MAEDNTQQAIKIAYYTVQLTATLMQALEGLESLEAERSTSGLDLTVYDTAFAADTRIMHADGVELNAVLNTTIPAIRAAIDSGHDTNLNKVRGGLRLNLAINQA